MNFIPLFNEKIRIGEEAYINHPSFHFGRIINNYNFIRSIKWRKRYYRGGTHLLQLTEEQQNVVNATDGKYVVLAGAGYICIL